MPPEAKMSKIKICGLTRTEDITAVNEALPDYIGFVFAPSRRRVTPEQALELRKALHPGIIPVGVFVDEPLDSILALEGVIDVIQLHGSEDEEYIKSLKGRCNCPVIKAVSIEKAGDAQRWQKSCADYLLLDRKGGGTGLTFDWSLIGEAGKPYFLAGGLNLSNIADAVDTLSPFCIDISSGAETGGLKDAAKVLEIVKLVREFGK
jgi:phosphoribosylanthranilate isomerase